MKDLFIALAIFVLLSFLSCSRLDEQTAAVVNGERISADDLYHSIHFFSQYAANKKGRELVEAHLQLLIDKKLFAQEGRRRGFDRTPRVQQIVDWAEKDQLVKALYRDEIRNKVQVSEEELREAFFKGREQVRLRHLFVRSESEALDVKLQLDRGVPFEAIAAKTFRDSLLAATGGDLGWVSYDDIDENLAEVAFDLPEYLTSAPVRSRWGYHLLRVDGRRQQIFNTDTEFLRQRVALEKQVRRYKEKKAAGAFVKNYMAPLDVKMMNPTFLLLAAQIKDIVLEGQSLLPNYRPLIGSLEIERLRRNLSPQSQQVLVTFKGGQWTLQDFIDRVQQLPLSDRPRIDTPANLRHDIGVMIMREFLAREAKNRGLHKDPDVRQAVQRWRDDYTFSEFWQTFSDTLTVSETEKQQFFTEHPGRYLQEEKVAVREIFVDNEAEARQLLQEIRRGADFSALARLHSKRPGASDNGGYLGLLKRFDYGNVSIKAFELKPGEIGGPVQVQGGFSIVKNEGYYASRPSTFAEAIQEITHDARKQKEEYLYQQMRAELRRKATIKINEPLIEKIAEELPTGEPVRMMNLPLR